MQTHNKFKQSVKIGLDVNNELTSSMIEDATLARIEVLMVETCATNEANGSHELASVNETSVIKWYHSRGALANKCSYIGKAQAISTCNLQSSCRSTLVIYLC